MISEETPHFWCRNENGQISLPEKRRIVSNAVSRSDIRVQAALANTDKVQDCRSKSLYEICLFVCVRHVNSIAWDCVTQHLAVDILRAAHYAGTIADETVVRLIKSGVHSNFITGINLSNAKSIPQSWMKSIILLLKNTLTTCDLSNCKHLTRDSWSELVHLTRLEWLSLSGNTLDDSCIKKLVYPTKYSNKGLLQLRYLDISDNPDLSPYAISLAGTFPLLQVLVTQSRDQRYFIYPEHSLCNWGHDIVIRWITGELPAAASTAKFYNLMPPLDKNDQHTYKKLDNKPATNLNKDLIPHFNKLPLISYHQKQSKFNKEYSSSFVNQIQVCPLPKKKRPIKCVTNQDSKKRKTVTTVSKRQRSIEDKSLIDSYLNNSSIMTVPSTATNQRSSSLLSQLDSGIEKFYC